MTLFTKSIRDITSDDVTQFCNQMVKEGYDLDYKRDFPAELEKTISAFANTYGGIIILGIADDDGKPKPPYLGIKYERGLEERVTNISINSIFPPVLPEVAVCKMQGDTAFILIRVAESDRTPHAVAGNTRAYVRTGNVSTPEDLLTFEQIDWLRQRRKKSEELRLSLYANAALHYTNITNAKNNKLIAGLFDISFCPLFPSKAIFDQSQIRTLIDECSVKNTANMEFPLAINSFEPIKDGVYSYFRNPKTNLGYYFEMNRFGLIFQRASVCWSNKNDPQEMSLLRLVEIFDTLELALESAHKIYDKVGYRGLLELRIAMNSILGLNVQRIRTKDYPVPASEEPVNIADNELSWSMTLPASILDDPKDRQAKFIEFFPQIAWALGVPIDNEMIASKLRERKRFVA